MKQNSKQKHKLLNDQKLSIKEKNLFVMRFKTKGLLDEEKLEQKNKANEDAEWQTVTYKSSYSWC